MLIAMLINIVYYGIIVQRKIFDLHFRYLTPYSLIHSYQHTRTNDNGHNYNTKYGEPKSFSEFSLLFGQLFLVLFSSLF